MDICVLFIIPMIEKGEFKHVGVLWSIIGKSMPHFCDIMLILRWKMMEIEMSLTSKQGAFWYTPQMKPRRRLLLLVNIVKNKL